MGGKANPNGAGGTMAIPLPPGITQIHRLRVAGQENKKEMTVTLFRGGWDPAQGRHVGSRQDKASKLVEAKIKKSPYDETYVISEGELHGECSTLSLEIQSTGYSRVSLIAVEIS